jgi:hypothetical protein
LNLSRKALKKISPHPMQNLRKGIKMMNQSQAMLAEDDAENRSNRKAVLEGEVAQIQQTKSLTKTKWRRNWKSSQLVTANAAEKETIRQLSTNNDDGVGTARRLTIVSSQWTKYMLRMKMQKMPRRHPLKEPEEVVAEQIKPGSETCTQPMGHLEEAEVLVRSLVGHGVQALLVELIRTAAMMKQCNVRQVLAEMSA